MESQNKPYQIGNVSIIPPKIWWNRCISAQVFSVKRAFSKGRFWLSAFQPATSSSGRDHLSPTTESVSEKHENAQLKAASSRFTDKNVTHCTPHANHQGEQWSTSCAINHPAKPSSEQTLQHISTSNYKNIQPDEKQAWIRTCKHIYENVNLFVKQGHYANWSRTLKINFRTSDMKKDRVVLESLMD